MTAVLDGPEDIQATSHHPSSSVDINAPSEDLSKNELVWLKLRPWLAERGYKLRPRYQPGWKGSWHADGFSGTLLSCEDSYTYIYPWVMDAVRIHDGALVMLKQVEKPSESKDSGEIEMAEFLSQESLAEDSQNHCVQIYETLDIPEYANKALLVMPLLYEVEVNLDFDTLGEIVDFFFQIFEGLQFMHQRNIAYRDCKLDNILADSGNLYNERPHPLFLRKSYDGLKDLKQRYTRTRRPIRYHYIDFGLSKRYSSRTGNLEPAPWGAGLYQVPEFQVPLDTPTDPFPVDIYMLGMMVRQNFLEDMVIRNTTVQTRRINLEWMEDLTQDMTKDDPSARPRIEEVIDRFNVLVKSLGTWKLRAPVNRSDHTYSAGQKMRHWLAQASRAVRLIPAIPRPPHRPRKAASR